MSLQEVESIKARSNEFGSLKTLKLITWKKKKIFILYTIICRITIEFKSTNTGVWMALTQLLDTVWSKTYEDMFISELVWVHKSISYIKCRGCKIFLSLEVIKVSTLESNDVMKF